MTFGQFPIIRSVFAMTSTSDISEAEKALFGLQGENVKVECALYPNQCLCGMLEKFWSHEIEPDKINFIVKVDNGKDVLHGMGIPYAVRNDGDVFVFVTEKTEYTFTRLNNGN